MALNISSEIDQLFNTLPELEKTALNDIATLLKLDVQEWLNQSQKRVVVKKANVTSLNASPDYMVFDPDALVGWKENTTRGGVKEARRHRRADFGLHVDLRGDPLDRPRECRQDGCPAGGTRGHHHGEEQEALIVKAIVIDYKECQEKVLRKRTCEIN